ncbi:diguanylate cyclase [Marinomonas ostreistagni]|uniref:sensor domain-containing diguanylate cyclase n=1 Tax=Marinomonas ostreistagni TaxID=359209 RepID=UPI00194E005E|nr:diguanylate cyclase [Marinomonas ostreistagni]MBM6551533.1 diguanylate cyclase [Marinomonas ostreistagni]
MTLATPQDLVDKYNLAQAPEPELDALLKALARTFDVPIALVAVKNEGNLEFRSRVGLAVDSLPIENTLCQYVLLNEQQIIIEDLAKDPRFLELPLAKTTPTLGFYAGTPVIIDDVTVGSLCIMDYQARSLTKEQATQLEELGQFISHHLKLYSEHNQLRLEHSLLDQSAAVMLNWHYRNGLTLQSVTRNVEQVLGLSYDHLIHNHQNFESFLTVPSQEDFHFMLQNHLSGVETTETNLELYKASKKVWIRLLSKAFYHTDGRLHTIQAIATDNTQQRYIENRLNEANRRMHLLLEASELGTWDYDAATESTSVNRRWCEIIGVEYEFYDGSNHFWQQRIHPADLAEVLQKLKAHINGESSVYSAIYRMKHEAGHWVWIETYGRVVERDEMGEVTRIAGTHRDITERKHIEIHQHKQTQLLGFIDKARAAYLETHDLPGACQKILPELIEIADSQFAFIGQVLIEDGRQRLFIHAISELSWNSASEALISLYKDRKLYFDSFDNLFGEVIKTEQTVISNKPNSHHASRGTPSGHPPIYRFMGLPIQQQGGLVGMVGLANKFSDYTQEDAAFLRPLLDALAGLFYAIELEKARIAAEDQLTRMAMTDALTGLHNRRAFIDHTASLSAEEPIFFAMLDIDFFKQVNDTYGHDMGDKVIKSLTHAMQEVLGDEHFIARMGGEEFAVVLHGLDKVGAEALLEALRLRVAERSIAIDEGHIAITISIGVAPHSTHSADQTLNQADHALYKAKETGRNKLVWSV